MPTTYCVHPETLGDMLADAYVDLRELAGDGVAAELLDRIYQALTISDGLVCYDTDTIEGLVATHSDWLRAELPDASDVSRATEVLCRWLTDDYYLCA